VRTTKKTVTHWLRGRIPNELGTAKFIGDVSNRQQQKPKISSLFEIGLSVVVIKPHRVVSVGIFQPAIRLK
jgi:hypothetical protein